VPISGEELIKAWNRRTEKSDRTNYCGDCGSKMDIVYQDDKVTAIKVTGW
jgi:hypothetical protein